MPMRIDEASSRGRSEPVVCVASDRRPAPGAAPRFARDLRREPARRAHRWALSCALARALAAPPLARAAESSRMTGRVVDAATNQPIANAEVELANAGGGAGFFRARTGKDGAFTLEGVLPDRNYSFSVDADGYAEF